MKLRILTEPDLRRALTMPAAIEAVREAFAALSSGDARVPVRNVVDGGEVTLLSMPGVLRTASADAPPRQALGAKLVAVAAGNRARGLPAIHAVILLMDPVTGVPSAVLDAEWLTALRTGAASGVATDLLAPADAEVLGVIGAGGQARSQIDAVRAVRPIRDVRICSRSGDSAHRLAAQLTEAGVPGVRAVATAHEAIRGAQVVVTATDAHTPVFETGSLGAASVHVNAVGGYRPDMQEVPTEVVARARVVAVDQVEAVLREAGDIVVPLEAGVIRREDLVELGTLVREFREAGGGVGPMGPTPEGLTFFKSVGNAVQDLAVATRAVEVAEIRDLGTVVEG